MSDPEKPESPRPSPWSPPPPPKIAPKAVVRPPLDRRQWGWLLVILAGVGAGVWAMTQIDGDWPQVAQWLLLLTIIGSGIVRLRLRPHEAVRNILLWLAIAAVLGLGYTVWMQMTAPPHGPPPARVVPTTPVGPRPLQAELGAPFRLVRAA
jgi:hypothetical protein